jgi:hypothetical protein
MKNLSIILTALTAGTAPLLPQTPPQPQEIVQPMAAERSGKEAIASVRETYENGGYDEFLKELDDFYKAMKESGQLEPLAKMRLGTLPEWQDFEARAETLQDERNQELLEAMDGQKKTSFVEKVISATTSTLFEEDERQAIDKIAKLRGMAPGNGKNSDENRLIDLDLEYEYKSLHLDIPGGTGEGRREKQCALKMEQLDKMLAASNAFKEESVKETVAHYGENFDERLAQNWDIFDLNALALGKRKPADALEDKVASILTRYQEKFSDLWKEFLDGAEKE